MERLLCFRLTIRNVNEVNIMLGVPNRECFRLTIRNVNAKFADPYKIIDIVLD